MSEKPKRNRGRRKRRVSKEKRAEWKEDEFLREARSSNGATGMHTEGIRPPIVNRYRKHESKPYRP